MGINPRKSVLIAIGIRVIRALFLNIENENTHNPFIIVAYYGAGGMQKR